MQTALAERQTSAVTLPKEQLELVRRTVANGATNDELALFLYDCERRGIHPLDKLLHFTKRGGKYTPVTSIDFMRAQAAMSGEMAGSDDPIFTADGEKLTSATVTVYRMTQGQRFAYAATARWSEYCPDNAPMWRRMPHTMLGKCAEALALRKAFPQQLAGLYSREEMDQADAAPGYVVEAPARTEKREKPSVPNGGELGPVIEPNGMGVKVAPCQPESAVLDPVGHPTPSDDGPDLGVDVVLPEGADLIVRCEKRAGNIEVTTAAGNAHLVYKQQLQALAEEVCQNREPVVLDLKRSASGNYYVNGITKVASINATKWTGGNCPTCLSDPCQCGRAF